MAQEADVAVSIEDVETRETRNGRVSQEPRAGSWTSLAEGHRELFWLEAEDALAHGGRLLLRAAVIIFSLALGVVFLNLAALYAVHSAGYSWGAAFLVNGAAWLVVAAAALWAAKAAPRFVVFDASRRQVWETAQWLARRLF